MNSPQENTRPQPRTKPAEVRLDELMDAAENLFISKGFEATTVSEIVRDAGVAKGTFYHYFPSKIEVLGALRERFTRQFIDRIQLAMDACPANDAVARLHAWCNSGVAAYLDSMAVHDALYHDHHYPTRGNQDRDTVLDQVLALLNEGIALGAWQLDNPRLTAMLMYHGMHGAVDNLVVSEDLRGTDLGAQLSQQFLRLLGCG
ncbi:TetR/AcrR family transcriptional regulator [Erwinia sp. JUb26]|uniref:TetR/AcrR family transcriptional regulator n=1 Tax=Erwinia sp. JUb26 TaxID=2485126 RepID=UPI000F49AFB4|nr:TetR/AcrR family transcriptional regulator [Erwinia sp. JUb26]ROR13618.1 TetR family transcriptional regulator [Erwinia sp. JUb26]